VATSATGCCTGAFRGLCRRGALWGGARGLRDGGRSRRIERRGERDRGGDLPVGWSYSDGRHPDVVKYTKSAEEDVRRRDFTINGLLLDAERLFPQGVKAATHLATKTWRGRGRPDIDLRAAVIDHVGGLADSKPASSAPSAARSCALRRITCGCCCECVLRALRFGTGGGEGAAIGGCGEDQAVSRDGCGTN